MAFLRRNRDEAVGDREIAHVLRQDERREQTGKEQAQTN